MTDHLVISSRGSPALEAGTESFARLYEAHCPAVFNYCLYRVGDAALAEDLTADVFERAWRARRRYNPQRAQFSTWLLTIARRVVIDWSRRQARRRLVPLKGPVPSPQPGPESLAAEAEDRRRLRQLLLALPGKDQDLLALKFGAGLTNRQIAEIVGKSQSAVGSALYRLVRKLRRQWESVG